MSVRPTRRPPAKSAAATAAPEKSPNRFGALPVTLCYAALAIGLPAGMWLMLPQARALDHAAPVVQMAAVPDEEVFTAVRSADRQRIAAALRDAAPPVPLKLAPKPRLANFDYDVPTKATPAAPSQEVTVLRPPSDEISPAANGNSPAQAQARASIEADGYKRVRVIERTADGKWRALALRGNVEIALVVDESGSVSSQ